MSKQTEEVNQFLKKLKHPLKKEIEKLREIILSADKDISEHIKWNAPSFCYNGDDRVTFRLQPGNRLQLIFHRGAKVKDATDFVFEDTTGLLEWITRDRAAVTFTNIRDVDTKKAALKKLVNQWMQSTK